MAYHPDLPRARPPLSLRRKTAVTVLVALALSGCTEIWNASDLAAWVRNHAVVQGCRRETIELETWYTETAKGSVWRGTCLDEQGAGKAFGINVDGVWQPSRHTT